jgi:transposase
VKYVTVSFTTMTDPKRIEMTEEEFNGLLERLERGTLTDEDRTRISECLKALAWMGSKLESKDLSIHRLRRLFGVKTESLSNLFGVSPGSNPEAESGNPDDSGKEALSEGATPKKRPKGHGKKGAKDFPDAPCIFHPHESMKAGDRCPECSRGRVYATEPGSVIQVLGSAPIQVEIHQPEKLRCNACGRVYTAKLPEGIGEERADEKAHSLIGLFKYGSGIPFYRLEGLQAALGFALPDATQWDMAEELANRVFPAYRGLIQTAPSAERFQHDDTGARILALSKEIKEEGNERTGIFTTGVIAVLPGAEGETEEKKHKIALFFTGNRHAGENLQKLLAERPGELASPKVMCDALSRNVPEGASWLLGFCLDHARRNFVDLAVRYPKETKYFIETLAEVYHIDAQTRKLTDDERLAVHQEKSKPVMEGLKSWGESLISGKQIEPNSELGKAIRYFSRHFEELAGFYRIPGMPLSNTATERLLKRAVLHRKNALFYRTQAGAWVGDVLMSLIETARMAGVNILDYLTDLQKNRHDVQRSPENWLPWNYARKNADLITPL